MGKYIGNRWIPPWVSPEEEEEIRKDAILHQTDVAYKPLWFFGDPCNVLGVKMPCSKNWEQRKAAAKQAALDGTLYQVTQGAGDDLMFVDPFAAVAVYPRATMKDVAVGSVRGTAARVLKTITKTAVDTTRNVAKQQARSEVEMIAKDTLGNVFDASKKAVVASFREGRRIVPVFKETVDKMAEIEAKNIAETEAKNIVETEVENIAETTAENTLEETVETTVENTLEETAETVAEKTKPISSNELEGSHQKTLFYTVTAANAIVGAMTPGYLEPIHVDPPKSTPVANDDIDYDMESVLPAADMEYSTGFGSIPIIIGGVGVLGIALLIYRYSK